MISHLLFIENKIIICKTLISRQGKSYELDTQGSVLVVVCLTQVTRLRYSLPLLQRRAIILAVLLCLCTLTLHTELVTRQ